MRTKPLFPLTREDRMRKHLRIFQHFAAIAASASRDMANAERCKMPGWGGYWAAAAENQRDAAARARDSRKRYAKLKAHDV